MAFLFFFPPFWSIFPIKPPILVGPLLPRLQQLQVQSIQPQQLQNIQQSYLELQNILQNMVKFLPLLLVFPLIPPLLTRRKEEE